MPQKVTYRVAVTLRDQPAATWVSEPLTTTVPDDHTEAEIAEALHDSIAAEFSRCIAGRGAFSIGAATYVDEDGPQTVPGHIMFHPDAIALMHTTVLQTKPVGSEDDDAPQAAPEGPSV